MTSVRSALIPAAGAGRRARPFWPDLPKGFIPLDGETLIGRSVRLLEAHGIRRIVLVAGYRADCYREFARSVPSVEVVENNDYASSGSLASVACALPEMDEDFLLVESDLYYEPRALGEVLSDERPDVVLASTPSGAGDEYWVEAPRGLLRRLSPDRTRLASADGEFVGITRCSARLGELMLEHYVSCASGKRRRAMNYEEHALAAAASRHEIGVRVAVGLLWGEVDCEEQFRRLQDRVEASKRSCFGNENRSRAGS